MPLIVGKFILGWFMGVGGTNPVKTWATILLVGALAFGAGNVFANKRAVATAAREAASIVADKLSRDQAAQGVALIQRDKDAKAKHDRDDQIAHAADDHAHKTLNATATAAERSAAAARQALALERQKRQSMEVANASASPASCPVPIPFSWPGTIRVFLDAAAGAIPDSSAADGAAEDNGPGGASGTPAASGEAARLKPDDLADGYSSLGKHDQVCRGKLNAAQDWIEERLRER